MNIEEIADEISSAIVLAKQVEPFSKRGLVLSLQEAYDVARIVRKKLGPTEIVGRKLVSQIVIFGALMASMNQFGVQLQQEVLVFLNQTF